MDLNQIIELMTPPSILEKTEFERAWPILPERFPTFGELLTWKRSIRDLILLPVKSDEMRAYYNSLNKEMLLETLLLCMSESEFLILYNEFPYLVPEGTLQYIIWIKNPGASQESIVSIILEFVEKNNFKIDELILFERPLRTSTKLVKGTFPSMRHVHLR